jgi:hypothetical protein
MRNPLRRDCMLFNTGLVIIGLGLAAIILGQVMVLVELLGR